MLISAGFILLAIRRFIEYIPLVSDASVNRKVYIWIGIAASFSFAVGLFLIQKIFRYMKRGNSRKSYFMRSFREKRVREIDLQRIYTMD